jgi:hypothetical protein
MTDSSSDRPADALGSTRPERDGATPRDASYWAKAIRALEVGEVPAGAVNLNVAGRRLVGPVQGSASCGRRPTRSTSTRR